MVESDHSEVVVAVTSVSQQKKAKQEKKEERENKNIPRMVRDWRGNTFWM